MAELINKALSIYQEAGRLSDQYIELSEGERGADKVLLQAAAGFLSDAEYNAARIVCALLLSPAEAGQAESDLSAIEREIDILSRLYDNRTESEGDVI